jgi:hypothetical protein
MISRAGFGAILGLAVGPLGAAPNFTIVALPDPQNYSDLFPEIYLAQTEWIAANAGERNIVFVSHMGDFVNNHDDDRQWDNAEEAMDVLESANIPWAGIPGNHEFLYGEEPDDFSASRYRARFGPQRFAGKSWYKGASPSELSNYQVIDVGEGSKMLFLHLNLETPASELAWAQGVLNANRDKPVFLTTHRYLQDAESYTGGVPLVASGRFPEIWYTFEPLYLPDGLKTEVFFSSFVKANKNIFLVHCGHFDAEFRQSSTNNYGLVVHEILADYQDGPNGGDGWMRLLEFRPDQGEIFVQTFSPSRNNGNGEFRTGSVSQFFLSVDLDDYIAPKGTSLLRFQEGVAGYHDTQDTHVNSDTGGFLETDGPFTDTSFGNSRVIVVDNDWDNSPFGDEPVQGLLRFDKIIGPPVYEGDPAPILIPSNAAVINGNLSFNVLDDIEIGDEDLLIYRCNRNWSEESTWNSLDGGLSGNELIGPPKVVNGDNVPNGATVRNVDVTNFVAAWLSGAPNNGFAILPENTAGIDDGMTLASSEHDQVSLRPALDLEFSYTVLNRAPNVTPLAASRTMCEEGESIVLTLSATDPNPADLLILRVNGADLAFGVGTLSVSEVIVMENDGSFEFAARVLDDEVGVNGGTVTITVANVAPSITALTENLEVDVNAVFGFEATATDPGILDVLDYEWDLDGDGEYGDAEGSSGSHAFAVEGSHLIGLRVSDEDGGEVFGEFTVEVAYTYATWAGGYNLTGGPEDDDDGDGTSNGDEFTLRFDPTDPAQHFALYVDAVDEASGTVTLRLPFVTKTGIFHVQYSGTLSDNPADWTPIQSYSPAEEERDVIIVHLNAPLPAEGYYRSVFEAAP